MSTGTSLRRRAALTLTVGVAVAGQLVRPGIARAHVALLESDPAADAGVLESMPSRLVLRFTGPIEPGPRARLLTVDGAPVPGVTASRDPRAFSQLLVDVPPGQAPGAYTALWEVVSLEDGHEQRGFLGVLAGTGSLAVSAPVLDPAAAIPGDLDVQLAALPDERGVVRWVTTVGGPTAPAVTRVQYRFSPPIADLAPLQVNGEWSDVLAGFVSAQPITVPGEWKTEVVVRREGVPGDVRLPFVWSAALAPPAPVL